MALKKKKIFNPLTCTNPLPKDLEKKLIKRYRMQDSWISFKKKKPANGQDVLLRKGNKSSDIRIGHRYLSFWIVTLAGWGFSQDEMIQRASSDLYWMDLPKV